MIIKLLRFLMFPLALQITLITLQKMSGNLYSYPILAYLTFNKKAVRKKYVEGKSMAKIVESKANIMAASMSRHLLRKPIEFGTPLFYRYHDWCERQRTAREIEEFIEEYELNVKPTPNEKDKR